MGIKYNPFSLEGKTILVIGASSGIGKETAISCSKMGAKVIISARNEERLNETFAELEGENHQMIIADLTIQEQLESIIANIEKIDGLVMSAGKGRTTPALYATREKFDDIYNINFFAQIELFRLLVKKKKFNQNSSAVFIVSIGGINNFAYGNAIYGSAKAALKSMIPYFAREFASKNIRVNGICPGMIETPLIHKGTFTEEQIELNKEQYPLKRYGKPVDVANGAIYLLSDASSWVTGHSICIDGGLTAR